MPPVPRILKEMVLDAAFALTREKGLDAVHARALASELHCSTQPVFRLYETMEQLKEEVRAKAEAYYNARMMAGLRHPTPFLGMGLAYVAFAKEEKQLFRLLFLNGAFTIHSFDEMVYGDDNAQIVAMIAEMTSVSKQQAQRLLLSIWLLMHGMATMIATNAADISDEEVEELLTRGFKGFLSQERGRLT